MKKALFTMFSFLLISLVSCKKENNSVANADLTVTASGPELDLQKANAAGIMVYNHFKYNLLNKKYDNYFWIPEDQKNAIDAETQKFADLTKGYETEQRFDKLVEQKKLSTSESIFLKNFLHGLEANAEDSTACWNFAQSQQTQLIASHNYTNEEKTRLLTFSSLAKFYAKNAIENHILQTPRDLSKVQPRDICIFGHQLFCSIGNGLVQAAIALGGAAITPSGLGAAIGAFVASIIGAPFGSCDCGSAPSCAAPTQYSLYIDGTCSLTQSIFIGGGADNGQGWIATNSNASPSVSNIPNGYYSITQQSATTFVSDASALCSPTSGILRVTGNFYSLIHNPGNPSFVNGNSTPRSGTNETYWITGNVNQPGAQIVVNVAGSLGQVIGTVTNQNGFAITINWFRSGWGSVNVQTQSSCGELSNTASLQIKVQ